jgi:phosphoglycolate phosphatase-like HAD superfamily hydrolase
MRPRAVLLDIDGTLIDSNDAHARAWAETGDELGYDIPFEKARPLIGMGGDKVLPRLTGLHEESDEGRKVLDRRGEIFRARHLQTCRPFPDARELLLRMRDDGIKLVIATSASEDDLRPLLERAGIEDLIHAATHADDAEESKPAPDIVHAALDEAGHPAAACLMIGDTPYDVAAANSAGVRILAVRCGGWGDDDLKGAAAVFEDPTDILAHYDRAIRTA